MSEEMVRSEEQGFSLTGAQRTTVLVICFLLYLLNYADKQVLSVVMEPMIKDLGMTDTMAGLLQTTFFLSMAILALPMAYLVDRWSRRKALALMAVVWSVATFVTGLARSFMHVLIPRLFVGVGEAAFPSAATAMLSAAYPKESRSRVLGIFNAGAPLGMALGTIGGGYIAAKSGDWRTPFLVFAVPGIFIGLLALLMKDYKTLKSVDTSGKKASFVKAMIACLKIPTLRWVAFGYAMNLIIMTSFMVWTPAFLMRTQGLPVQKAGLLVGMLGLLGIVGAPLGGFLADMWQKKSVRGRTYMTIAAIFPTTLFYFCTIYFEFKGIGMVTAVAQGIFIVLGMAAVNAISQDVVHPGLKGASWGMVGFFTMFAAAIAPSMIGGLSDYLGGGSGSLKTAMLAMSVFGLFGGCFFIAGAKNYEADVEKVKHFVLESE